MGVFLEKSQRHKFSHVYNSQVLPWQPVAEQTDIEHPPRDFPASLERGGHCPLVPDLNKVRLSARMAMTLARGHCSGLTRRNPTT